MRGGGVGRAACFAALAAALLAAGVTTSGVPARAASSGLECHAYKLISVRGSGDNAVLAIGVVGSKVSGALARDAKQLGLDYSVLGLPYTAVGIAWWKLTAAGSTAVLYLQYQHSKNGGRDNLRALIKQQVKDCPSQKLALVGFSQGSHVIGDVLSKKVGGLNATETNAIAAVALVADPRFNSREPFVAGSFERGKNGLLGARSPGDLDGVKGKVRSWCKNADLVCQRGSNPFDGVHNQAGYYSAYGSAIVRFIEGKLGWPAPTTALKLSPLGLGPIRIGMTRAQASQAIGRTVEIDKNVYSCEYWRFEGQPNGVYIVTFELGGRLALIDLTERGPTSTRGITVGDTRARMLQAYSGRLRHVSEQTPGLEDYFVDQSANGVAYTLRFSLWKGVIISLTASTRKTIENLGECK
jgi:hypothetical protein